MEQNKVAYFPLVSIIIPTYNREERITATLNSVCNQDYDNIEIIIVDDGSQDSTCTIVESFIKDNSNRKITLLVQENKGAPAARNSGFRNSRGKYVVFFDSDDIMLDSRISTQVIEIVKTNSEMCGCGFFLNSIHGHSYIPPELTADPLEQNIKKELLGSTQSWMFSASLIKKIGGYDELLKCKQDLDIVFRALKSNVKVCVVKKALSIFVKHDGGERIMLSTNNLKGMESIFRFNFKVVNYCAEHLSFRLYTYSIRALAQDLSTICSVKDIFSDKFITTMERYILKRNRLTKIILYYYLSYKLIFSPDVRQSVKRMFMKK